MLAGCSPVQQFELGASVLQLVMQQTKLAAFQLIAAER